MEVGRSRRGRCHVSDRPLRLVSRMSHEVEAGA
jgi:hypothetical protein